MKIELDEDILFLAFRYAITRSTYVVGTVSDTIIANWDSGISKKNKALYHKEIKIAIEEETTMWDMDKQSWERVLKLKQ